MPKIKLSDSLTPPWESFSKNEDTPQDREPVFKVLGLADSGASRRGSTYWKSLYTCPREFAFRNVLGFKPIHSSEALTVGWLYHYVLETYYQAIYNWQQQKCERPKKPYNASTRLAWENYWWGNANAAMQESIAVVDPIMNEPGYRDTWATLERLFGHYFDTNWKTDRWEVIAVEETLEYEDARFNFTARLDLIVRDWAFPSAMWIVEHKSARLITRDLIDNYQMDLQILGQNFLIQNCLDLREYPELKGTLVQITTKQTNPRFERIEAFPSQRHIAEFADSMQSWSRLRGFFEGEAWPKALGKCAGAPRGYTKCDYYDICHDQPDMTVDDFAKSGPPMGYVKVEIES